MTPISDETDIEVLRRKALMLDGEVRVMTKHIAKLERKLAELEGRTPEELQQQLQFLEEQLAAKNRALFGDSSEKRPPAGDGAPKKKRGKKRRGHGPRPQPQLPVIETEHALDEPDQVCPRCGGQLEEWEGQFEESEEIDVIERQFVIRKHKRKKYRCRCNACVETALGPVKLIPGGRYSLDFAVDVAVQKYLDHLPLERQVRVMARQGLEVTSQTLWDQLDALARVLAPHHDAIHAHVLQQPVIGADETTWRLMGNEVNVRKKLRKSKKWFVWAVAAPDGVSYRIFEHRSAEAAKAVLGDYGGQVITDGYAAYGSLKKNGGRFALLHCWAHVRRKFREAAPHSPEAEEMVDLIGELYAIERSCPRLPRDRSSSEAEAVAAQRQKIHDEHSRAVVKQIYDWYLEHKPLALPKSSFGKALSYLAEMWPGLEQFLDDPWIPLDNNGTERALRGVVIGRKNHYGSKSKRGTEVAALFYTLLESAKLAGVNPAAYLKAAAVKKLRFDQVLLPHEYRG